MRGRIEVICGCMFSGKSELLIRRVRAARSAGVPAAAFKHASDDRYDPVAVVTHSGWREPAVPARSAGWIGAQVGEARLVAVDEAQFFDAGLVGLCQSLASEGREVVVAGLDRNAWGQPFGPMPELERICDVATRMRAVCARCGAEAAFTQRTTPIRGDRMIGGRENYEPRCGACFRPPPVERSV
jgi:thymidine kinase